MWPKSYKDYPKDSSLVHEQVESGKGIIGCSMTELNGWGETFHTPPKEHKKSLLSVLLKSE